MSLIRVISKFRAAKVVGVFGGSLMLLLSTTNSFAAESTFMDFTNVVPSVASVETSSENARDLYNLGTRRLREKKLQEAEALFNKALTSQDESVRAPSLYNLGHVRFQQGDELLKKSPDAKAQSARGRAAAKQAEAATRFADAALQSEDLQRMTAAYLNGRGARREIKSATQAVKRALQIQGAVLQRWQRSLQDFKSTVELNPADTNAQKNVELMERSIAKLIDSIREMQQAAAMMAKQGEELRDKMKQLGGKIPEPMMSPGAKGEDDEEGEGDDPKREPPEMRPGMQEKAGPEGSEMKVSPEEAEWILDGFKLDSGQHLPMKLGNPGEPKDRKGRDW